MGNKLDFPNWLQLEMDKRGWSQSDLARAANLNRAVINKILNGRSHPRCSTLQAIARAFWVPVESVYRAAGLLPIADSDETLEEAVYLFRAIRSPQRKAMALSVLRALLAEEINSS